MRYLIILSLLALLGAGCHEWKPYYVPVEPEKIGVEAKGVVGMAGSSKGFTFSCGTSSRQFSGRDLLDLTVAVAEMGENPVTVMTSSTFDFNSSQIVINMSPSITLIPKGQGKPPYEHDLMIALVCGEKEVMSLPRSCLLDAMKEALIPSL